MCLLWTRAMQTALVFSAWDQSNIPWNFVQTDRTVPILSTAFWGIDPPAISTSDIQPFYFWWGKL